MLPVKPVPNDFRLSLRIANSLDQVWLVRAFLRAVLQEIEVADMDCAHVQLAVSEAINNCIEHSYHNGRQGDVDVLLELNREQLQIEIADDGVPLRLEEIEALLRKPIPEVAASLDLLPHGRGLQIIRDTMDSVVFLRQDDRNVVRLRKSLRRHCADSEFSI
jgi:serine/threonine-protein kinase RsbW